MAEKELVITHLQIIHTWADFALERDLQFFTKKHLEDITQWTTDALVLLKEQENEYENGFNDAMLGKQELMYEGTDGKWHKKDW